MCLNHLSHYDILKSEKNRMCKVYTKRNPLSTANTEGIFYIGIYSKSVSGSDTIVRFFLDISISFYYKILYNIIKNILRSEKMATRYILDLLTGEATTEDFPKKRTIRKKGKSLLSFPESYTVIDIETTGLDSSFDSIIEIGAMKIADGKVESTFSSLLKPPAQDYYEEYDEGDFLINNAGDKYYYVDSFITNLTHITNEMLDSAPEPKDVLKKFLSYIGDDILVGHNVNFDINFLFDNIKDMFGQELSNDYVDTLRLSRRIHTELSHHTLAAMSELYHIENSAAHRALSDCETTYHLLNNLYNTALEKFGSMQNFQEAMKPKSYPAIDVNAIQPTNTDFNILHPLYQKVCCFTGKLENLPRKDAMQLVVDLGGIVSNSVTKKTNYLILGNNDYCPSIKEGKSSKQKKAEKLKLSGQDIEIISENTFYDLLNSET